MQQEVVFDFPYKGAFLEELRMWHELVFNELSLNFFFSGIPPYDARNVLIITKRLVK